MLNELGFKTSRGVAFNKNSLRTILKNEKYIGVYQVGDVRIEDGVPSIIEREIFDKVQARLAENAKMPQKKKAKADYLLSGKLFCGSCNKLMTGYCGTSKTGTVHYYYQCAGHKLKTCNKTTVKKDWLESLICAETVEKVLNADLIDYIAERCAEISAADANRNDEVNVLQKRLTETEKSIVGIMSAMEQGIFTRSTKERLETLEKQRDKIERELSDAKAKIRILPKNEIKYVLSRFVRETTDNLEAYNRDVLNCFVHKAILYEDKVIVFYNISKDGEHLMQSECYFDFPPTDDGDSSSENSSTSARNAP